MVFRRTLSLGLARVLHCGVFGFPARYCGRRGGYRTGDVIPYLSALHLSWKFAVERKASWRSAVGSGRHHAIDQQIASLRASWARCTGGLQRSFQMCLRSTEFHGGSKFVFASFQFCYFCSARSSSCSPSVFTLQDSAEQMASLAGRQCHKRRRAGRVLGTP